MTNIGTAITEWRTPIFAVATTIDPSATWRISNIVNLERIITSEMPHGIQTHLKMFARLPLLKWEHSFVFVPELLRKGGLPAFSGCIIHKFCWSLIVEATQANDARRREIS